MKGNIYFIGCLPLGAVKIGFTKGSPVARLRALQTGSAAPLKMYGYFPGTMDDEKRLHEAFKPLHIHGEWFRLEGKLNDFTFYIGETKDHGIFINALHDVLMQGLWHPSDAMDHDTYYDSGDWEPFRKVLWKHFGPWEE